MKLFLDKIRAPRKGAPLKIQITVTVGIVLMGFTLGVLQKWIDGSPDNMFPLLFQQLDIGNYFGREAIWILLGTIIAIYSRTPLRASVNTFLFFISWCNYPAPETKRICSRTGIVSCGCGCVSTDYVK